MGRGYLRQPLPIGGPHNWLTVSAFGRVVGVFSGFQVK
jgi:hypothetical protein